MIPLLPAQCALRAFAHPSKATILQRFFKTGAGEYGEGDVFLGVTVPETRRVAAQFSQLSLKELTFLMKSSVHEDRLLGLIILVKQFQKMKEGSQRAKMFALYLSWVRAGYVNNWDLVDTSAYHIVGAHLETHSADCLDELARSENLWERRVAMVATYFFIQRGDSWRALRIARLLLHDEHDLIHKAVGWMLREVGKRCSVADLEGFLQKNYHRMPRTMLRYAIERLPEARRRAYLRGLA
jgi:3-methyladenine DNA glycosylase AlkD